MSVGTIVVADAGEELGRALCKELCDRGHRVAGLARRVDEIEATAHLAGNLFAGYVCDIADPIAIRQAFHDVRSGLGPVDVLINNASVYPRRDILDESAESFMETIATNIGVAVACTREALTDMVARGEGRIINVGCLAEFSSVPASMAYAVSKGAVQIFSRALVADLGDRFPRIVVSHWIPGLPAIPSKPSAGLSAEKAARWGATLALMRDASLNGTVWEMDREMLPLRSVALRAADLLRGRYLRRRRLPAGQMIPHR